MKNRSRSESLIVLIVIALVMAGRPREAYARSWSCSNADGKCVQVCSLGGGAYGCNTITNDDVSAGGIGLQSNSSNGYAVQALDNSGGVGVYGSGGTGVYGIVGSGTIVAPPEGGGVVGYSDGSTLYAIYGKATSTHARQSVSHSRRSALVAAETLGRRPRVFLDASSLASCGGQTLPDADQTVRGRAQPSRRGAQSHPGRVQLSRHGEQAPSGRANPHVVKVKASADEAKPTATPATTPTTGANRGGQVRATN
jgi:hypothetical protein